MGKRRAATVGAVVAAAITMVGLGAPALVHAADHLDAPAINGALQSPAGRHDADINDLFAFRSPSSAGRSVLALTTHPLLGAVTTDPTYGTDIRYNIHLDPADDDTAHGEGRRDIDAPFRTIQVTFGRANRSGDQRYTVSLYVGRRRIVLGYGLTNHVSFIQGGRAFAGKVSDPFFFDLGAFNNTVQGMLDKHILPLNAHGPATCTSGQGVDTFAAANSNAIVLEVPNWVIGGKVDVWASTVRSDGTQIDRMGRPAINTVFNGKKALLKEGDDNDKNIFNSIRLPSRDPSTRTSPDTGPTFHDNVVTVLKGFDGVANQVAGIAPRSDATVQSIANLLLPDRLPFDPAVTKTDGVTNGRSLTDDVIDNELPIVTNGLVSTDCVGPHSDYRATFPYLGAPH